MKSEDVAKVLNDVQSMKGRQDEMTQRLDLIRRLVQADCPLKLLCSSSSQSPYCIPPNLLTTS